MTFDLTTLPDWIARTRADIAGDRLPVADGRGDLIFRDYGADVLLIAHVDWVGEPYAGASTSAAAPGASTPGASTPGASTSAIAGRRAPRAPKLKVQGGRIAHPALDDRLGCWAIEQLHAAGVHADLLFTDCEEFGASTGADFVAPREYKLLLMFDRAGTDAVLYQYEDVDEWRRFCARHVGPVDFGTYSCIAAMSHVGACGVNVGIGYHEHNGPRCWADTRLAMAQMARGADFIARARRRPWHYIEAPRRPMRSRFGAGRPFGSVDDVGAADAYARYGVGRLDDGRRRPPQRSVDDVIDAWLVDNPDVGADDVAGRLCRVCDRALSDGDLDHVCPFVADCDCCADADEYGRKYAFV